MIGIYYHDAADQLEPSFDVRMSEWLAVWPAALRERIKRRRITLDRQRSALGWRLLELHLVAAGHGDLTTVGIDYPVSGKPRCGIGLDFSISHSGSLVACAISDEGRVGIDVERVRALNAVSWRRYLTDAERAQVVADPRHLFDIWTRKEAVVKARGGAALADVPSVELDGERARLYGDCWHLVPLGLCINHAACVASEVPPRSLTMRRMTSGEIEAGFASKLGSLVVGVEVAPDP